MSTISHESVGLLVTIPYFALQFRRNSDVLKSRVVVTNKVACRASARIPDVNPMLCHSAELSSAELWFVALIFLLSFLVACTTHTIRI